VAGKTTYESGIVTYDGKNDGVVAKAGTITVWNVETTYPEIVM
jgi:hypothetical protein